MQEKENVEETTTIEVVLNEASVVTTENDNVNRTENLGKNPNPEVVKIELIKDPQARVDAMYELQLLTNLINTHYFLPKFDKGNGGTQRSKITASTQLNFFSSVDMDAWGAKVLELSARLGFNKEAKKND